MAERPLGPIWLVIPGRASSRTRKSITPVFKFIIHTPAQGVWISGLRQEAHPGMTASKGVGYVSERHANGLAVHAIAIIRRQFNLEYD
jgi:hypothetical protein